MNGFLTSPSSVNHFCQLYSLVSPRTSPSNGASSWLRALPIISAMAFCGASSSMLFGTDLTSCIYFCLISPFLISSNVVLIVSNFPAILATPDVDFAPNDSSICFPMVLSLPPMFFWISAVMTKTISCDASLTPSSISVMDCSIPDIHIDCIPRNWSYASSRTLIRSRADLT